MEDWPRPLQTAVSTGGWNYAHFDEGKPLLDAATLQRCFECHLAIKDQDFVFTRYTP